MAEAEGKKQAVALYGSRSQEGHVDSICRLITRLKDAGLNVYIERKLAGVLENSGFRPAIHGVRTVSAVPADATLALSVGGDGTFLRTARWLAGKEIPILGINTGHLGFLAENSADDVEAVARLILDGEARAEKRLVLEVECEALPKGDWPYALNEVALLKGAASMIDISVTLDGFHLADYRADGLLVATPTGSTAYNLSVGGPILSPTLENIVLSPIAPHTLTLRPVVIGGDSVVEATVESRAREFRLSLDGRSVAIPCGVPLKIRKAAHSVITLRRPGSNFASTLRSKLLWGH